MHFIYSIVSDLWIVGWFLRSFISAAKNQSGLTTIEGEFEVNTQYHFYMETQSIIARPSEKGQIDIYAGKTHR